MGSFRDDRAHRVYTYCIVDDAGHCKIGVALSPRSRLCELQVANPFDLRLHGLIKGDRETRLHTKYQHQHKRGEWFTCSPELLAEFDTDLDTVEALPPARPVVWRASGNGTGTAAGGFLHAIEDQGRFTRSVCGRPTTNGWVDDPTVTLRCFRCLTRLDLRMTFAEGVAHKEKKNPLRPKRK